MGQGTRAIDRRKRELVQLSKQKWRGREGAQCLCGEVVLLYDTIHDINGELPHACSSELLDNPVCRMRRYAIGERNIVGSIYDQV